MTVGAETILPFTARCGEQQVTVAPDAEIGPYVIHLDIRKLKPCGPAWSVSHRSTGLVVWRTLEFGGALRVARWLDETRTIPADAPATNTWRAALTVAEQTRLIVRMHELAPRWVPEPM